MVSWGLIGHGARRGGGKEREVKGRETSGVSSAEWKIKPTGDACAPRATRVGRVGGASL